MKTRDLTGQRFGKLAVINRASNSLQGKARWACICDCGQHTVVVGASMTNGLTISCGCNRFASGPDCPNYKHGRSGKDNPTYRVWSGMKSRCSDPKNPVYKNWAGRGIRVCKRWQKFENFLADMGERPEGKSLDRINNDGDYKPSNCRWATNAEQSANSRVPKIITFRGRSQNLTLWAAELDICVPSLLERLEKWPLERAMTAKNSRPDLKVSRG